MLRDTREESVSYVMDFSQIPPGFQFQPSDHQIIHNHLQPKVFSESTMEIIIPDVLVKEFSDLDPFNLPVWTLCEIGETRRCEKDKACAVDSNTTWQQQVHEKQQTQTEATASYGWVSEPATASYGWVSEPANPTQTTALLDATTSGPAVMPLDEPAWMSADDAAMTKQQDEIYGYDDISIENAVNWITDNCTDADFLY